MTMGYEQHRTVNAIKFRWNDKLKKRQTQLASSSAEAAACLEVPPLRCRVPHARSRNCVELMPCPNPKIEKCTNSQTGSWGWMLREVQMHFDCCACRLARALAA